jgi:quinoprotein glucose dehydrogenase
MVVRAGRRPPPGDILENRMQANPPSGTAAGDASIKDASGRPPTERPLKNRRRRRLLTLLIVAIALYAGLRYYWAKPPLVIPVRGGVADWPNYGRDPGGSRYAPLKQITPGNVMHLAQAWVYRTGEDYSGTPFENRAAFEATPILLGGKLYLSTQTSRVIALDPETGKELWVYDPEVDTDGISEMTSRGVSAWIDPETKRPRIYVGTLDARLIALDGETGKPITPFGHDGQIDLTQNVGHVDKGSYQVTSPPAVINDVVVVGSAIGDNRRVESERGIVRGFNARSGESLWTWDPIPRAEGDPGWDEWQPEQAKITGGGNTWSILSADPARDLVFVPTGSASPDYYGGERLGSNRYANCVVALRASTGEVVWSFQLVHHDLWDYDVPSQPTLCTVYRCGEELPAVAQASKMGHLFFFHRETGEPLFPIEERPVPASDVPGEEASPTQPFPVVTPPLVPQELSPDEAWGLTFWDRKRARERIESLRNEGMFTPPSLRGSLQFPGAAGGTNWGSVAFDPRRRLVVVNTSRLPFAITLRPRAEFEKEGPIPGVERAGQQGTPFGMHREALLSPWGLPVNPPPWGTLAAVSTESGKLVWQVPLGTIRDLAPVPLFFNWGTPNMGGPIVTESGLVFIAATMDHYLRAFDVETGQELWRGRLPVAGQATPMTYRLSEDGKQYVVICAGGHGKMGTRVGDYVIAFALPDR